MKTNNQLKEEWFKYSSEFADKNLCTLEDDEVADYWLSIIAIRDAELVKTLGEMKKTDLVDITNNPLPPRLVFMRGFNQALDEIINKVGNTEKRKN